MKASPRVELVKVAYRPDGKLERVQLYYDSFGFLAVLYKRGNQTFLCRFLDDDMYWFAVIDNRSLFEKIADWFRGYKV
jgi:hypothetical protein